MMQTRTQRFTIRRWTALLPFALLSVGAFAFDQYQIVDLGLLPSGSYARAYGVNNKGHVVGVAGHSSGYARGFFWNNGAFQTIAPDSSGDDPDPSRTAKDSYATGINDLDQVVGYRDRWYGPQSDSKDRAFRWNISNGTINNIANLANDFAYESRAFDINEFGTVCGSASGENFLTSFHAFRWTQNSGTVSCGTLTGVNTDQSFSLGINESAKVAGYADNAANKWVAMTYPPMSSLGLFPNPNVVGPHFETFGQDINDSNVVCGFYKLDATTNRAFQESNLGYIGLGLLPGANTASDSSNAAAINNGGDIVGDCEVGNTNHRAVLWDSGRSYTTIDLNNKIPANSGWLLQYATDISDNGYIVGYGTKGGYQKAYLLKPTVVVSGRVTLQSWIPSLAGTQISVQVINASDNSADESRVVTLDSLGNYSFETTKVGTKYLKFAHSHWLNKRTANMNFTSNWDDVDVSLINGDIDGDNEVGVGDYAMLSAAYNSFPGDQNWFPNADLNGDLGVDIGDYAILSQNYGLWGD